MMLVGFGKLRIASRYFWHGRTWSGVISKPVEFDCVLTKDEFLWVEDNAILSAGVKPVGSLEETFFDVVSPE